MSISYKVRKGLTYMGRFEQRPAESGPVALQESTLGSRINPNAKVVSWGSDCSVGSPRTSVAD